MPSKLDRLEERHVAALNGLVRQLRTSGGSPRVVPWADPDSGGVDARVLVLFESPANLTVSAGASAFSSEDNENATSRSFAAARIEAGVGVRAGWGYQIGGEVAFVEAAFHAQRYHGKSG